MKIREEELLQQISAKKNQEKYVQHTQQLINKFRAKKNKAAFGTIHADDVVLVHVKY